MENAKRFVVAVSCLGVYTDHVEPNDGRPGTLLLAGIRDDDHWEGGGLHLSQERQVHKNPPDTNPNRDTWKS